MKKENKKKNFKKINLKVYIPLGIVIVGVLLGGIVMIVMGLDKKYFGSTINGYVYDSNRQAVEGVMLKVIDKTAVTDSYGYYSILELDYGLAEISLSKNGYVDVTKEIKIGKLQNNRNFTITPLEYGKIDYKLSFEDNLFYAGEFEILLNNEPVQLDNSYGFSTEEVTIGKYNLKIKSPYYQNIDKQIEVVSGDNSEEIYLELRGDLRAELVDFLQDNGKGIKADRIQISDGGAFIDVNDNYVDKNKLDILDLEVGDKIKLKVFKEKYYTLEKEITIEPGINSLGQMGLVPKGSIIKVVLIDGQYKVQAVSYDGRVFVEVLSSSNMCSVYKHLDTVGYVTCANTLYKISNDTEKSKILEQYDISGKMFFVDMHGDVVIAWRDIQDNRFIIKSLHNKKEYLLDGFEITSVAMVDGHIIFTDNTGLYETAMVDGDTEIIKLITGNYKILDTYQNDVLLANYVDGTTLNIWQFNILSDKRQKLTFLPGIYKDIVYSEDAKVYFRKQVGNTWGLYNSFSGTSTIQNTWYHYPILGQKLIFINKGGYDYLYNLENNSLIWMR